MKHAVSTYRDGWKTISFCLNCQKEGMELYSECLGGNPVPMICGICGQEHYPSEQCENCQKLSEKFRIAIDKQNILQDERHRMARLLGYNPNAPETWPLDLIDRLINFEKAEGWDRLFHKINQMNGVKGY